MALLAFVMVAFVSVAQADGNVAAAKATDADSESPGGQKSGSFLVRVRPSGKLVRSAALNTDVKIAVSGTVARAVVSQQFRNDSPDWVEGIYVFPLPENAAVDRLRMQVGERTIEGQIREREQAKAEYAAARDSGRRASLVEQERPNIFTSSVANLGPGETLVVEIEYQQTLRYEDQSVSLRFSDGRCAALHPGTAVLRACAGHGLGAGHRQRGRRVAHHAARRRRGEAPRNPVTIAVEIDAGFPVNDVVKPLSRDRCREARRHPLRREPGRRAVPRRPGFRACVASDSRRRAPRAACSARHRTARRTYC
jgi:Ca-activated chloride channel family protein